MIALHPVSVLFGWLVLLLVTADSRGWLLLLSSCLLTVLACLWARSQFLALLTRCRWLMLAMGLTFGAMTPGTPVSWLTGATVEGLILAAESVSRLVFALATLALALRLAPTPRLIVGIRCLLAPLSLLGHTSQGWRDTLAVRLSLTLNQIERGVRADSVNVVSATPTLVLPVIPFNRLDYLIGVFSTASAGWMLAHLVTRWLA